MKLIAQIYKNFFLSWLIYLNFARQRHIVHALWIGVKLNKNFFLFNLRRNIHRIEKGLICKQPRSVFAEDYILETVTWLSLSQRIDLNTFSWGRSVLSQFFQKCQHTPIIKKAYLLYIKDNIKDNYTDLPYQAKNRPFSSICYTDLYILALRRRSIRYYIDEKVEFDVVKKAMEIAKLSPSACNRQSFEFIFYNNKKIIKKIIDIPGGFVGYDAPGLIIVVGNYRGYFDERDMYVPFIDGSLATMSFLFALETLNLSSVCINWPALPDRDKKIRELINLDVDKFVIMLIVIGHADPEGKIPYSAKLDTLNILKYGENI